MKKKTSREVLHEYRDYKEITDFDVLIKGIKDEYSDAGVEIGRIALEASSYPHRGVRIGFYKALTPNELKKLKEEQAEKERKQAEELAKRNKAEMERQLIAKQRAEKASEAAKKGWIKRHQQLAERKERDRLAAAEYVERQIRKRAEKEAKQEEDRKAAEFLRKILEEED